MDAQVDLDKVKSKLEKLLRLQEGATKIGSLEEAGNAAQKIQTLLFKYNLEMADICMADKSQPVIGNQKTDLKEKFGWNKSSGPWMVNLVNVISRANLCRAVQTKVGNENVFMTIFGEKENVIAVNMLVSQLIHRLKDMASNSWKLYNGYEKKNAYLRGYLSGAVVGIFHKLQENQKRMEEENAKVTTMVVANEALVSQVMNDHYNGNLRSAKQTKRLSSNDGRARGYQAGKSMNIHKAIG